MGTNDVEQAIQRLADDAVSLTLDQRLRIAALLARPVEPPATTPSQNNMPPHATTAASIILTVEETADLLKIGRTTAYDLIKTGQLSSIMIGRLRRIRYLDVVAYLHDINHTIPVDDDRSH